LLSCVLAFGPISSHRNLPDTANVYFARVFPYPNTVAWFAAQGMPQSAQINQTARTIEAYLPTARAYATPAGPNSAPIVGLILTQPYWSALATWVHHHGQTVFAEYLPTHPYYAVTAPTQSPPLAFNTPASLGYYQVPGHSNIPLLDLLWPRREVVFALLVLGCLILLRRKFARLVSVVWLPAAVLVGHSAALVGWAGDAEELSRHMIEGNMIFRLAVLLTLIYAVLLIQPSVATGTAQRSYWYSPA